MYESEFRAYQKAKLMASGSQSMCLAQSLLMAKQLPQNKKPLTKPSKTLNKPLLCVKAVARSWQIAIGHKWLMRLWTKLFGQHIAKPCVTLPLKRVEEMVANWIDQGTTQDGVSSIKSRLIEQLEAVKKQQEIALPWKPPTFRLS